MPTNPTFNSINTSSLNASSTVSDNITWQNAVGNNTTLTNATSSNLFSTLLSAIKASITDLLFGNATGTNITATGTASLANVVSTGQSDLNNASVTALTANTFYSPNVNITGGSATLTDLTVTNFLCNITWNFFCDEGNTRGKNLTLGTNDNFAQIFETNNVERMRISAIGNVGIGTASPANALHISSSTISKGISGLRLGITNASTTKSATTTSRVLSVDANGDVVMATVPGTQNVVDFFVNANPNTAGTTFTPNQPQDGDVIYVSDIDNSTWIWDGAAYVTYTAPASTEWMLSNSTTDAGSNKNSTIWRNGTLGIGTSTPNSIITAISTNTRPIITMGNTVNNTGNWSSMFAQTSTNTGTHSFVAGYQQNNTGPYSVMFGNQTSNSGSNSLLAGSALANTGAYSAMFGTVATNSGNYNLVAGRTLVNNGAASTLLGATATNTANYSIVSGYKVTNSGGSSAVLGDSINNTAAMSAIFGFSNNATGSSHLVAGSFQNVVGAWNAVFGTQNNVSGSYSVVGGQGNYVSGSNSIVAGYQSTNTSPYSAMFGNVNTNTGSNSFVGGSSNVNAGIQSILYGNNNQNAASGQYAYIFGGSASNTGVYSILAGLSLKNFGNYNAIFGSNNVLNTGNYNLFAGVNNSSTGSVNVIVGQLQGNSGDFNIVVGYNNTNTSEGSAILGRSLNNTANYTGMFGNLNAATGSYHLISGFNNVVTGTYNLVSGTNHTVNADQNIVGGNQHNVVGTGNLVMGYRHNATGTYSVITGYGNNNSGNFSAVSGYISDNSGRYSAVSGYININSGDYSVVGGRNNTNYATNGLTQGVYNINRSSSASYFGQYAEDVVTASSSSFQPTDPLMVVGNGVSTGARSNAFTLLKNGNLGLGTSTPPSLLTLSGSGLGALFSATDTTGQAAVSPTLNISNTANSNNNFTQILFNNRAGTGNQLSRIVSTSEGLTGSTNLAFVTSNLGAQSEKLRITNVGNVGIGTTTPGNALTIASSSGPVSGLRLGISSTTATTTYIGKVLSVNANGDVVLVEDGVANPNVSCAGSLTIFCQNGNFFGATGTLGTKDNFGLNLVTNNSAKLTVASAGNVGIGTTTPYAKLDIYQSGGFAGTVLPMRAAVNVTVPVVSSNGYALFRGSGGSTFVSGDVRGLELDLNPTGSAVGNRYGVYISGETKNYFSGNVGIGTSTPNYKLEVIGDINAVGNVRANGVILTSDARFKQDVAAIGTTTLDKMSQVNPVSYTWNELGQQQGGTAGQVQYGFLAQEVEQIFPELVSTRPDGYKGVNYFGFIAMLVEAVKEISGKIEDLVNRVARLETDVADLKAWKAQMQSASPQSVPTVYNPATSTVPLDSTGAPLNSDPAVDWSDPTASSTTEVATATPISIENPTVSEVPVEVIPPETTPVSTETIPAE